MPKFLKDFLTHSSGSKQSTLLFFHCLDPEDGGRKILRKSVKIIQLTLYHAPEHVVDFGF
jgi:hypothetical protein